MSKPDYHEQIQTQEENSARKWNQPDRETSAEDRRKNMWLRVLNKVKTDKEG